MEEVDAFYNRHKQQLHTMGLPVTLHKLACSKILNECFDAGLFFEFENVNVEVEGEEDEDEDYDEKEEEQTDKNFACEVPGNVDEILSTEIPASLPRCYILTAKNHLEPEIDVFLVDHMWSVDKFLLISLFFHR